MPRPLRRASWTLLAVALSACASSGYYRTELYFGLSRPDGGRVTELEWQEFVETEVTPRFPAGITVVAAQGQHRLRSGVLVQEPSRVLVLIHRRGAPDDARIEELRTLYKRRFGQESVLRVTHREKVSF